MPDVPGNNAAGEFHVSIIKRQLPTPSTGDLIHIHKIKLQYDAAKTNKWSATTSQQSFIIVLQPEGPITHPPNASASPLSIQILRLASLHDPILTLQHGISKRERFRAYVYISKVGTDRITVSDGTATLDVLCFDSPPQDSVACWSVGFPDLYSTLLAMSHFVLLVLL